MSIMEIFFYLIIGGLMTFAILNILQLKRNQKIDRKILIFMFSAVFLVIFGIAWTHSSILENEFQAAVMGVALFSGLGIALGGFAFWKMKLSNSDEIITESSDEKSDFSPKKIAAIALLVLFTVIMPPALLLNEVTSIIKDEKKITALINNKLMSDKALPGVINKSIRYQVLAGPFFIPLEQRMIMSAASAVKPDNWVELFNLIAPENDRIELVSNSISSLYSWIDNKKAYPEIVVPTGKFVTNIKANAENIILWQFNYIKPPPCTRDKVSQFKRGIFGNDIKNLIGCTPPENIRRKVASAAAGLIKKTINSKKLPESISVAEKLKEKESRAKMLEKKNSINNLFGFGSFFWIFPLILFITALALVVRSLKDFFVWAPWPIFAVGIIGTLISISIPSAGFLKKIPKELPEKMPPPALAIGQEIAGGLLDQLGKGLFIPMMIILIFGSILLAYAFRENIKLLYFRFKTAN